MRDMKNSGIEWIGFVPKNWDIKKLKFSLQTHFGGAWGANAGQGEKDSVCIRVADFNYPHLSVDYNDNMTIRSYDNKVIENSSVIDGDILLEKSGGGEQTPVGRSVLHTGKNAMCANFIECLRPSEENDSRFLNYWLYSSYQNGYSKRNIKQTTGIQNLDVSGLLSEAISIPSIKEQKAIAEYLDKKCADIDEIISAKEKTNELLKERRQSIITEAVTKGLNPNAEMKDSGIDWIGEISFSKNVVRLKHYLENQMQYGANESGTSDANGNIRYIRITDINNDSSLKDNEDNKYLTIEQAESYILKDGDVLFARSGATVGKSFIYKESYGKCAFAGYLIKAECNRTKLLPKYLFYYTSTSTYESWKNMIFIQATIQNIGADKYQEMPLIMTSIEEQKEIVDYLDKKCEEIDKLIESNNKTIEKLQEYRKSLIYEAVTGKIEV